MRLDELAADVTPNSFAVDQRAVEVEHDARLHARCFSQAKAYPPSRVAQVGARALQAALRHSGDVQKLVERGKAAFTLAQLHDTRADCAPDSRHGGKSRGIGRVDVDAAVGRRRCTVAPCARFAQTSPRRFTGRGDVDLFAVGRPLGEVDAPRLGRCSESAGQSDRLRVTVAEMEMVEPRLANGAGHVDDEVVGPGTVPQVPVELPAGGERIWTGVRGRG